MSDYTAETRAEVHRLFTAHGYRGALLIVDDSGDECIFLVPEGTLASIDERDLCIALQATVRRKVWVVEATTAWTIQARPFD